MTPKETILQDLAIQWIQGKRTEKQILDTLKDIITEDLSGGGEIATDNVVAQWEIEESPLAVIGLTLEIKDYDEVWHEEIDLTDLNSELEVYCAECEQGAIETRETERDLDNWISNGGN